MKRGWIWGLVLALAILLFFLLRSEPRQDRVAPEIDPASGAPEKSAQEIPVSRKVPVSEFTPAKPVEPSESLPVESATPAVQEPMPPEQPVDLGTLRIEGRVSDGADIPLEGALIRCIEHMGKRGSTQSDAHGAYSLEIPWKDLNIPFYLEVHASGQVSQKRGVVTAGVFHQGNKSVENCVPLERLQQHVRIDWRLETAVYVQGVVRWNDGTPAPGATVQMTLADIIKQGWRPHDDRNSFLGGTQSSDFQYAAAQANTDNEGEFRLDGVPELKQMYLVVKHPMAVLQVEKIDPIPRGAHAQCKIQLEQGAMLRGSVLDESGKPVKSLELWFSGGPVGYQFPAKSIKNQLGHDLRDESYWFITYTREDGSYVFGGLFPGSGHQWTLEGHGDPILSRHGMHIGLEPGENRLDLLFKEGKLVARGKDQ